MKPYEPRTYRAVSARKGLVAFQVVVQETDLWIQAAFPLEREARELALQCRAPLEAYIAAHPDFARTLAPWAIEGPAPPLVRAMAQAGARAGVGPMAAVAGAVAQHVGMGLAALSPEVIVENGGDVFVQVQGDIVLGLHAGGAFREAGLGIKLPCGGRPLGVCTSSSFIGHSLSLGKADAVTIAADDCALADAVATAAANRVQAPRDVARAVDFARAIPGVRAVLALSGKQLATWGGLELTPVTAKKP